MPRSDYERALESFARGDLQETLTLVDRALAADPTHAESHALRGVALDGAGRAEEALAAYREAIRLKPDYAEAHRNLALLHSQRGEYAESLQAGRKAVELEPQHADALNNLGVAALKLGFLPEAEDALRRSLALDPSSVGAHYNLGLVHAERGRVAGAIDELEIAYQGAQQSGDEHRRGWIAEVATRLLNRYPADGTLWRAHRLLGRTYFDQGWYGTAIPHFQEGARRRDFTSLLHLGICYKNKALAGEAIDTLRRAARQRPDDYQAHNELGHVLGTLVEEWPGAEEEFRVALNLQPTSPEVRYNLGFALFRQQRYDEARKEFDEAFRLKPEMAASEHYRGLEFPQ